MPDEGEDRAGDQQPDVALQSAGYLRLLVVSGLMPAIIVAAVTSFVLDELLTSRRPATT